MKIGSILLFCLIIFGEALATEKAANAPLSAEPGLTEWYYPEWLGNSPHSPSFEVRDTKNKYGRYAKQTKTITLKDLIKFHGHICGGDVASYLTGACERSDRLCLAFAGVP